MTMTMMMIEPSNDSVKLFFVIIKSIQAFDNDME